MIHKTIIRSHLFHIITLSVAVLLIGVGCKEQKTATIQGSQCPEEQYYDIRKGACATPVTKEDRYVVANYKRFYDLSQSSSTASQPVRAQVSLSRWLREEEFLATFKDVSIITVEKLVLRLPQLTAPLVAPVSFKPSRIEGSIHQAFQSLATTFGSMSLEDGSRLDKAAAKIRKSGQFEIGIARITAASPSDLLTWWKANLNTTRLVQPLVKEIDDSQPPFEPSEPIE